MHNEVPNARSQAGGRSQTPQQNHYYAYHDPESSAKLSTTLVHALADVSGLDVTDAEFSLYENVDPDGLDRLFAPEAEDGVFRSTGHVAFSVEGYPITVYSDGQIVITRPGSTHA